MQVFILLLLFLTTSVQASDESRQAYLDLLKSYPNLITSHGDCNQGEIQIVTDPTEMKAIEALMQREVGIIAQDRYWLWVNDACIFPNGNKGVYGRILWVSSLESLPGVAVLPIMSDGKIALICNYRHATRAWEIELPRGCVNSGEDLQTAARRETLEETGLLVDQIVHLGSMPPDSGLTNTVVPIFLAKVIAQQLPQREDSEAIDDILLLTIPEIKQAFLKGYHECTLRGTPKKVFFRDPFLAYALLLYEEASK